MGSSLAIGNFNMPKLINALDQIYILKSKILIV